MFLSEAMSILGLTHSESWDENAIKRSWKDKIKLVHPDKQHQGGHTSTQNTQRLNEAKDTLLSRFSLEDMDEQHYEEQQRAREKEQADLEAKKQQEEDELLRKECEEYHKKFLEARRERYAKNRKKRAPGARVHRRMGDYKEGRELIEEMDAFFRERFTSEKYNKLLVQDILELFVKSRPGGHTTDLEINLFKRHSKKLFLVVWPDAVYCTSRNKRCFMHVNVKK
jgi:curved DNA-binding protein CbpA